MGSRRAFLIGVEQYGHGFDNLPAARRDAVLMNDVLAGCGYQAEVCDERLVGSASALDKAIRDFCRRCGPDDVHILYFSGHGLSIGGVDYIVPGGTSRSDAVESAAQRVSTDVTSVFEGTTGMVLFIVDACRDPRDAAGAGREMPAARAAGAGRPQARFVRFFGCSAGEFCQVLPAARGQTAVSLFSRALSDAIRTRRPATLHDVLGDVEAACRVLSAESELKPQTPRVSIGELSAELEGLLNRPIFDPPAHVALPDVWERFDPNAFHGLVVTSEHAAGERAARDAVDMVRDALPGESGRRIWNAFHSATNGRPLVSGERRRLPDAPRPSAMRFARFNIVDALTTAETLDRAVRAVIEADLAVFDVTGFEPGVMLLMGVRAACARGVTICSHGGGWVEGTPLEMPFNLQNLSVQSHTPSGSQAGDDQVVLRFADRVVKGYTQLLRHGHYLDLPAFDDLRQLGSRYDAVSTIGVQESVLVLCSYHPRFFSCWQHVRSSLKNALWTRALSPKIERIIDLGTPQLVSQALCEQLRRTAACVIDWSEFSASAFMELGIRLAVSSWGAVHLIERRFLPGDTSNPTLRQIDRLVRVFNPIPYAYRSDESPFQTAVASLVDRTSQAGVREDINRVHAVAVNAMGVVHPAHPSVFDELREAADSLHHQQQEQEAVPQILFHGSFPLKRDGERAALERRIAAWLYLEHRLKAGTRPADDPLATLHGSLGRAAMSGLYERGEDGDVDLALTIEGRLAKDPLKFVADRQQAASAARKTGDRLRERGDRPAAIQAFQLAIAHLDQALDVRRRGRWSRLRDLEPESDVIPVARDVAEMLGSRAGLYKRLDDTEQSLAGYAEGAALERRFQLPSTYNRLNHVKQRLTSGTRLASLESELHEIVVSIEKQLGPESGGGDSGWAWGDLADCRALLDDLPGAVQAYTAFIAKSQTKSPERALETLRQLAAALDASSDPGAARVQAAVQFLEQRLGTPG
jgi:tetratricopeptide (TPR) repeat protein